MNNTILLSTNRTLRPWLDKYDFEAHVIPLHSFLHASHKIGECMVQTSTASNLQKCRKFGHDTTNIRDQRLESFDDIHLFLVVPIKDTNISISKDEKDS